MGTIADFPRDKGRDRVAIALLADSDQFGAKLKDWVRKADQDELHGLIDHISQMHDLESTKTKLAAEFALTLLSQMMMEVHEEAVREFEKGADDE